MDGNLLRGGGRAGPPRSRPGGVRAGGQPGLSDLTWGPAGSEDPEPGPGAGGHRLNPLSGVLATTDGAETDAETDGEAGVRAQPGTASQGCGRERKPGRDREGPSVRRGAPGPSHVCGISREGCGESRALVPRVTRRCQRTSPRGVLCRSTSRPSPGPRGGPRLPEASPVEATEPTSGWAGCVARPPCHGTERPFRTHSPRTPPCTSAPGPLASQRKPYHSRQVAL